MYLYTYYTMYMYIHCCIYTCRVNARYHTTAQIWKKLTPPYIYTLYLGNPPQHQVICPAIGRGSGPGCGWSTGRRAGGTGCWGQHWSSCCPNWWEQHGHFFARWVNTDTEFWVYIYMYIQCVPDILCWWELHVHNVYTGSSKQSSRDCWLVWPITTYQRTYMYMALLYLYIHCTCM